MSDNPAASDQPTPVPNSSTNIVDLVVKDLQDRAEVGLAKYGVKLQPFNGRNALMDKYQEQLDDVMYTRQLLEEQARWREHVERVVSEILTDMRDCEIDLSGHNISVTAHRVADRLSAPVLSREERTLLEECARSVRREEGWRPEARAKALALLDRLLTGAKP